VVGRALHSDVDVLPGDVDTEHESELENMAFAPVSLYSFGVLCPFFSQQIEFIQVSQEVFHGTRSQRTISSVSVSGQVSLRGIQVLKRVWFSLDINSVSIVLLPNLRPLYPPR
jgi:hypothetical protein